MTITLSPDQEAWLQSRVANGEFASVEAAARQLLAERIAELESGGDEVDDLAWAKPYVDEGLAAFARGEFITLEEHRARNDARRAARGKSWRVSSSLIRRTPIALRLSRSYRERERIVDRPLCRAVVRRYQGGPSLAQLLQHRRL